MPRTPLVLLLAFLVVSGGVFTLAELHLAKPSAPHIAPGQTVILGAATGGKILFAQNCAGCHGAAGVGGGVGPKLAGQPISLAAAQAQIDAGGGVMPGGIVNGKDEQDVLAYLATILKSGAA